MNIVQCQFCRKPFASLGGKICPDCLEQIDKDFITVRDYIDEHKRANVDLISKETEVSKQHIVYLIKEGRLILDDPSGGLIVCEVCKKPISTGRVCADCAKKVSSSIDKKVPGGKKPAAKPAVDNFKSAARVGHR